MADFAIQKVTLSDARQISEMGIRTFVETYGALLPSRTEMLQAYAEGAFAIPKVEAELVDELTSRYYLIHQGGHCAGYAMLSTGVAPAEVKGKRPVQLQRLYFERGHQAKGGGRFTLVWLKREAAKAGHDSLWAAVFEENFRALRFYQAHGFHEVGQRHWRFRWNGEDYADNDRIFELSL